MTGQMPDIVFDESAISFVLGAFGWHEGRHGWVRTEDDGFAPTFTGEPIRGSKPFY